MLLDLITVVYCKPIGWPIQFGFGLGSFLGTRNQIPKVYRFVEDFGIPGDWHKTWLNGLVLMYLRVLDNRTMLLHTLDRTNAEVYFVVEMSVGKESRHSRYGFSGVWSGSRGYTSLGGLRRV